MIGHDKRDRVSSRRFAVIADDLTGAADSGAQFARNGRRTAIFFQGERPDAKEFDTLAFDTDSRAESPGKGRNRVAAAVRLAGTERILFKKIDSTLRGNVAVEIEACMDASGLKVAVVAPAFPSGGRATIGGVQLVGGEPVHRTELARDPKTPVAESHIPTLLAALGEVPTLATEDLEDREKVRETLARSRCVVCDAKADEDLEKLVRAVEEPRDALWVGSAGLAAALAALHPGDFESPVSVGKSENVLVVVGSLSGASREQLRDLEVRERAVPVVLGDSTDGRIANVVEETALRCAEVLRSGKNAALHTSGEVGDLSPTEIAGALAEVARRLEGDFDSLILTGGDTAVAVARRLGATGIEVFGEVEAGVPFGRLSGGKSYPVVTKAGGFGSAKTLGDAVDFLTAGREVR